MRRTLIPLLLLGLPAFAALNGFIQPNNPTLGPLQQQQFTLPGYAQAITWSVQPPGMGTITSNGLYTPPNSGGVAFVYAQPQGAPLYVTTVFLSQGPQGSGTGPTTPGQGPNMPTPGGQNPSPSQPTPLLPSTPTPGPVVFGGPVSSSPSTPSGVSVSLSPASLYLQAGQSAVFTAIVQGTPDNQVQWSISPNLGSLISGVYQAPSSLTQETLVTISATSNVDSSKTATATVLLGNLVSLPPASPSANVSLSLSPGSASLQGGQSATFTATVSGTSNTAVTWSLSPQVGTITNGVYQAPAIIASQQTVTVTATSAADTSKTASATVSLTPVAVTIGPASVSLGAAASATFSASVTGTSNTAVTWSLSPAVGTIVNGVYTAPATIPSQQTVTVTASSVADPTKTATATVTLTATPTSAVSVGLSPRSASLQGGQSATFTATVSGNSDKAVTWAVTPQVGTITDGVYQAPAIIANHQTVTVTATSAADTTKTASATVSLTPVAVTIGPASVSLGASASATFSASVTGTSNTAVTWSLSPAAGTIVNGAYTAPATISSQQTVTVTASSVADPTKTATATVTLTPPPPSNVSIGLSPGSASLQGGQSATFTATVSGNSNKAVTWSLSPQVGTITNGVYQAPAIVASQQTVTVTATSAADTTKTATATVSLSPVAVTIGPATVLLGAAASATFSASVTGTSNTAVTWSLSPAAGTIVNGMYTAPATISNQQTVTVTASSAADPTKTATATVTLTPASSGPATPITLPVEVIGPNGTTATTSVTIPSSANLSGPLSLSMQIHGLRFETQASVQVNNSSWMPISDSTVTLLGNATAYGGIGGGFSTLKMTMNLPANTIQAGTNTISFRFNQTDGRVSGFRVLAFNVQAADGSLLLPASTFVYDDPNNWQPPSTSPSDITAGQTLWSQAALTVPLTTGGTKPILAHCSDCHATDGRDLKYFNYSNNSIQARALFHGLTAQQGQQIASYIRSLNVVNPGRPWNPPYQPGPGLDSQPVINWAAGAGLDAVLDTDQEMLSAMFPSGYQDSVFAATSRLNQRETPIPLQLPDWNQWLPGTHPMDAFGSTFTGSGYNTIFQTLSSNLQVLNAAAYVGQEGNVASWFNAFYSLLDQVAAPIWAVPGGGWTPATTDAIYSLPQWGMVKTWQLMNEFQLEGFSQNVFGPTADPRGWNSALPFFVSPHDLKMNSAGTPGLRNGSRADYVYLSYIWYHLQLILNNSHEQDHFPIDYPYVEGFTKDLGSLVSPQAGIQTLWIIKGLQSLQETGTGPQLGEEGWQPNVSQISYLVTTEWNTNVWTGVDPTTRAALATGMVKSWFAQASQFTPQQYYTGGWASPTAIPVPGGNAYDQIFVDWAWYMIPRFLFVGVDSTLVGQLAQWTQTLWPSANWTADLSATCNWLNNVPNGEIACSQ
jgi:hypothetical protein